METTLFADFENSSRAALAFLRQRLGFDSWIVTRKEGDDWIVLQSEDHGYGIQPGSVFPWSDTYCSRMVDGRGPHMAPRVDRVPAYSSAPIGLGLKVGAYVGVPLTNGDGSLFGTLCAIHPSPHPESIVGEQGLVELIGRLLSTILQYEIRTASEARRAERAEAEAQTDALTALYNRGGWLRLLDLEENRCRRYGHPAVVLMMDLDGLKQVNDTQGHNAGDDLIVRGANALRESARSADVVARLGGDEFAVLAVECDRNGGEALRKRVRAALVDAKVNASIGFEMRDPSRGLAGACDDADRLMYEEKRAR